MTSCPENQLIVRGAREHNLAGFDIALPRDSFIVITGVSGSGKSSLAFDTIFREGQRRFLKTMPSYARLFATGLACPIATSFSGLGPALAVGQRVFHKNPRSTVGTLTEVYDLLRLLMARLGTCEAGAVVSRGLFSFNTQEGACPVCLGLGVVDELDTDLIVSDPTKTLRQGALRVSTPNGYLMYSQVTLGVLDAVLRAHGGDVDTPWRDLTDEVRRVVFHGSQVQKIPFGKHPLESRMKWTGITARPRQEGYYRGLVPIMEEILKGKRNDSILRFVRTSQCPTCRGTRLRPEALAVRWRGHDIAELSRMTPPALNKFLHAHSSDQNKIEVLDPIRRDLSARCGLMEELGLSYLTFDRTAPSLSAGEAGRLRLASLLLGELRGLVLVLDEPSCELHPQDTTKLLGILQRLRDNGQTVIAVEHDPLAALAADWLVELGPGPGNKGGRLLWNGSPAEMLAADNLPLSPTKSLLLRSLPARPRRVEADLLGLPNLSCHNIENAHISLLRHGLNVVTGVSGAGKTSLLSAVIEALARSAPSAFDRVVSVDAEPIGRTPRSNPATYSNAFDAIRNLFAATPKAKEQGLSKSSFSFNTAGGRCEKCEGAGTLEVGMRTLGSVALACDACGGQRFHPDVLSVTYRDKNIAQVLESSVEESAAFFSDQPKLRRILGALVDVGLGYLRLGQPATTLSGGEAARVKLATELAAAGKGRALVVLDEPSTGLHGADLTCLMASWDRLLDAGHTLLVADSDIELVRAADRVIEVGPGSGLAGGKIIFQGSPEGLERCKASPTGPYLTPRPTPRFSAPRVETPTPPMSLFGVRTHNLQGFDIEFPSRGLTVVTGPSGSGKSSLVLDTLLSESQHRFADLVAPFARSFCPRGGGALIDSAKGLQAAVAVQTGTTRRHPRSTVATSSELDELLRLLFSRIGQRPCAGCGQLVGLDPCRCGKTNSLLWAGDLSPNTESGACPACKGLGFVQRCDPDKLIVYPERPIFDGAMDGSRFGAYLGEPHGQHMATLAAAALELGLDVRPPWSALGQTEKALCLEGAGSRVLTVKWSYRRGQRQGDHTFQGTWPGLLSLVEEEHERVQGEKKGESLEALLCNTPCFTCQGERLRPESRAVSVAGKRLPEVLRGSIKDLRDFVASLEQTPNGLTERELKVGVPLRKDLLQRLSPLLDSGLGYLRLDRETGSLSGGELQRLRLACALGGGLVGVTYVLDEPTQGLHPRDVERLCGVLKGLAKAGNAVVVVEHDPQLIAQADWIIELGPGGGPDGGRITSMGPPSELAQTTHTARLLKSGPVAPDRTPRELRPGVTLSGARLHNLKDITVSFPQNALVAVCGVSGSGKSTLVREVLGASMDARLRGAPALGCDACELHTELAGVVLLAQGSTTGGAQSTVATLCGVSEILRKRFAATDRARQLGLSAKHFSTASPGGRCEACEGRGTQTIPMDFLPDVTIGCEVCQGQRFDARVLECRLGDRTIAELLETPIGQLTQSFWDDKPLTSPLCALVDLGLSYLRLGQEARELSAGELQRLRLALLLAATDRRRLAVLLDEPTRGLGFEEIERLVDALHGLVEAGHMVVVVEHNLDLIAAADWVIDLGPEGGEGGGQLIIEGPPRLVASCPNSYTGKALGGLTHSENEK